MTAVDRATEVLTGILDLAGCGEGVIEFVVGEATDAGLLRTDMDQAVLDAAEVWERERSDYRKSELVMDPRGSTTWDLLAAVRARRGQA